MKKTILLNLSLVTASALHTMHKETPIVHKSNQKLLEQVNVHDQNDKTLARHTLILYKELNIENILEKLGPLDPHLLENKLYTLTHSISNLVAQCSDEDKPTLTDMLETALNSTNAFSTLCHEIENYDTPYSNNRLKIQRAIREAFIHFSGLYFDDQRNIELLEKLSR